MASDSGHFSLWPEPQFAIAATPDPHSGLGGPVTVRRHGSAPLSGNVIFPITPAQANGLEDLRLVRFTEEDGSQPYYGTYTAYSGREVSCEMMTTNNFSSFDLTPMRGAAAKHKGLALFPRRVNGKYAAIGRLDSESLFYLESDDRFDWNNGRMIMAPKYPWELVQLGNCGSPIELDEGWLLLTHGVGAMRQYAIGAALLDEQRRILAAKHGPDIGCVFARRIEIRIIGHFNRQVHRHLRLQDQRPATQRPVIAQLWIIMTQNLAHVLADNRPRISARRHQPIERAMSKDALRRNTRQDSRFLQCRKVKHVISYRNANTGPRIGGGRKHAPGQILNRKMALGRDIDKRA